MTYSTNFSIEDLRFDNYGLIPAIAQDWLDGSILMLAWMNKESLTMTLETKNVHYWSRSRSEIWRKGATSGSTQILKEIRFDCDNDALILLIEQNGSGACHTGEKSCFFNEIQINQSDKKEKKTTPFSNICSELFWRWANEYLKDRDKGRTCCWKTDSKENKSNKASYEKIPDWFKS